MQKEGRFWPTDQDRTPRLTRFWVNARTLSDNELDDSIAGVVPIEVIETSEHVENRLKNQFPIYRATKIGASILGLGSRNSNEI